MATIISGSGCANCDLHFTKEDPSYQFIFGEGNEESLTILKALSTVYGYPSRNHDNKYFWKSEENFLCCGGCTKLVTAFYKTYLELIRLSSTKSSLVRRIQDFTKRLVTCDLNEDEPCLEDEAVDDQSSDNCQVLEVPIKKDNEKSTESFENALNLGRSTRVSARLQKPKVPLGVAKIVIPISPLKVKPTSSTDASDVCNYCQEDACICQENLTHANSRTTLQNRLKIVNKRQLKTPAKSSNSPVKANRKLLDNPCEHCDKHDCECLCRCTVCSQQFRTCADLFGHIKSSHGDEATSVNQRTFTCPICISTDLQTKNVFVNYYALKSHVLQDHQETVNWCTDCGRAFRGQGPLKAHRRKCSGTAQEPEKLEPGEIRDASNGLQSHKCVHCKIEFPWKHNLTKHLLSHNDTKPKFGCAMCPKSFYRDDSLRRHVPMHTWKDMVSCPECGKHFEREYHLNRHIQSVHCSNAEKTTEKQAKETPPKTNSTSPRIPRSLTCSVCSKTFGRHENLKLHMRIHTGEKPYLCTLCGKSFRDSRNFAQHKITHKNDRPFCCSVCGSTFKRAHHLADHEQTHRADTPRPFVCQVATCGKSFKLRKHLQSHELVHSGQKQFTCHVCGRAFSRKDNLNQHIGKLHGKQFAEDLKSLIGPHLATSEQVEDDIKTKP